MRSAHLSPWAHRSIVAAVAALLALSSALTATDAAAGPSGRWERISPPYQVGGAAVYSPAHRLMYVFGGDGTNIVHAVSVDGPPDEWQNLVTTGTPPSPREGAALAYDGYNDRLLLFGGRESGNVHRNDVWELSLSGVPTWQLLNPTGVAPEPCADASACFDESRGDLLVFGGASDAGLNANAIHALDFASVQPNWVTLGQSGAIPEARAGATLSLEPTTDRALLFGGSGESGDLADAVEFDLGTGVWTAISPTGDVPPATRTHFAGYDDEDGLLFVWGGSGGDGNMRTLAPATGVWTIQPDQSWQGAPTGHTHPIGAWIPGTARLLVLDGQDNTELFAFNWSVENGSWWENMHQPSQTGAVHCAATFVVDRANDRAYLSGGLPYEGGPALQSTWSYDMGNRKGWYDTWFHNLATNETPGMQRHVAVWDDARARMLVFGGMNSAFQRMNGLYAMNETYESYGGFYTWETLSPGGTLPTARHGAAAIYDPVGDRMLMFGGSDVSGWPRGDLWQLTLSPSPTWTQIVVPGGPSARQDHTAIYDALHRRMIVFAGTDSVGSTSNNDVWALNLPALTWTHLLPTGTPAPGRYQHTAVYDSRRCRMLVFGGNTVFGADPREVWELDLFPATPVWTKLTPGSNATGIPAQRFQQAAVYDSTGDRMLMFGGLIPPLGVFGNSTPMRDLWSLRFDGAGAILGVDAAPAGVTLALSAPAPNPSRGLTRLSYTLPRDGRVHAAIFDVAGRRLVTLEDGERTAGRHELSWDGRDAGGLSRSGLYFCRVEAGGESRTQKVLRVR